MIQVETALAREFSAEGAVRRGLNGIAFFAQPIRKGPPQPRLIRPPTAIRRSGALAARAPHPAS